MNLAQALKQKNRLAGEIVRLQTILSRENSRRNDCKSTINPGEIFSKICEVSAKLGVIKSRIAMANVGIYSDIERMAEYKAMIAYLNLLPVREGEEIVMGGQSINNITYQWTAYITQEKRDAMIKQYQDDINKLQDKIDEYNATTQIYPID